MFELSARVNGLQVIDIAAHIDGNTISIVIYVDYHDELPRI